MGNFYFNKAMKEKIITDEEREAMREATLQDSFAYAAK